MKILHLAMILFCAILSSFIPSVSLEESIIVSTDKSSYHYGDNYTISGKVSPAVPNEAVSILILSTNYQHPESLSVIPNSEGRYLHTLSLPIKDISDGNYTIIAQYAGAKNQTFFNYIGLPCYQQNIPAYVYPAPIIRGPPAYNPRILDSFGNAITGPVKVGQQIQITYTVANGLDCNQPFVYIVQIQDHNGTTISLSWITGTLLAGQSFNPTQSWIPSGAGTYTAQIFTWQSLDNPNALVPPASISFDVESIANSTKSSQIVSEIPSKFTTEFPTTVPNSPLKQFKSGIAANHLICKKDMYVILKAENSFPACVDIEIGKKLVQRGWATTFGTSMNDYWSTCDKSFPQSDSGTSVLYMPVNYIGKICLRYSNPNNEPEIVTPPGISDPNSSSYQKAKDITIWTYTPISTISKDNGTTVAYFIKTGNQSGFYGISLPSCGEIPFAVGYNNDSKITSGDFPFLGVTVSCPPGMLYPQIDGIEGIGIKYIP